MLLNLRSRIDHAAAEQKGDQTRTVHMSTRSVHHGLHLCRAEYTAATNASHEPRHLRARVGVMGALAVCSYLLFFRVHEIDDSFAMLR